MKILSMKLAQAIPGETSLILFTQDSPGKHGKVYDIQMNERGFFQVTPKDGKVSYLVFPANVAYVQCANEIKLKPGPKPKGE